MLANPEEVKQPFCESESTHSLEMFVICVLGYLMLQAPTAKLRGYHASQPMTH